MTLAVLIFALVLSGCARRPPKGQAPIPVPAEPPCMFIDRFGNCLHLIPSPPRPDEPAPPEGPDLLHV